MHSEVTSISIDGPWFVDEHGRRLVLRGVNLGGSSKVPSRPDSATHLREGFLDHREVSFAGRPFPLEEAEEHFSRLRRWGLTTLRLLVTWEAIEHAGPGVYDLEYLDYLEAVVARAGEHGLRLFIDPHQDVWSRFSGGDGAPGWTLEAVGFDLGNLHATGAAFVHQLYGDPLPRMIWPTNYSKLASATMFTLFFGGGDFAPQTKIDGEPAKEFLQRHYIQAVQQVAVRLKGMPQVIGYDTMNEPSRGYIGWEDLNHPHAIVEWGALPSPYQSMLLGAGIPQVVGVWERRISGPKLVERRLINAEGARAWHQGFECLWRENGVWEVGEDGCPSLLKPAHFAEVGGRAVDFNRDYYVPFCNRFAEAVRGVHPGAMIFVEEELELPPPAWGAGDAPGVVFAPHWYDGFVLFTKRFTPFLGYDEIEGKVLFGPRAVRRSFARQLSRFKEHASLNMGDAPVLVGEVGIPFDLDGGGAYWSGDFRRQVRAMERTLRALDDNLLSYTLWNYTADNTNQRGDQWNGEDLSIFSRDQQEDPADLHSGGRALNAVARPYPLATAGEPLRVSFDIKRRAFELTFRHDPQVEAPSQIFVPDYQYPDGVDVWVSDGSYQLDMEDQVLRYQHSLEREVHTVRLAPW